MLLSLEGEDVTFSLGASPDGGEKGGPGRGCLVIV